MSALASLIGVECAECRRHGHHCQAQMWSDGEAMCLRCADGEPCYAVTAAKLETPARMRESDDCDDLMISCCRAQDCELKARKTNVPIMQKGAWRERDRIREQLATHGLQEVAAMHCVEPRLIAHLQMSEREEPNGCISILAIQDLVARQFGVTRDDLISQIFPRKNSLPRSIAMWLSYKVGRFQEVQIGRAFGNRHHTTVFYGVRKIERMCAADEQIKKSVEELKAALSES